MALELAEDKLSTVHNNALYIYVLITVLETSQQQQLPTWLKIHQKYPKLKDQKQRLQPTCNINSPEGPL
jgi:hypothetical protein